MRGARFIDAALSLLVTGGMALGLLCTPGVRHRHEGGEVTHTHGHNVHTHSHGHGHTHARADDDGHHHGRAATADVHAAPKSQLTKAPTTHLHVSLFGLELTLPDIVGGEGAPLRSSRNRTARGTGVMAESVDTLPPIFPVQIISMIFDVKCVLTSHVPCPTASSPTGRPAFEEMHNWGIDPPAPPLPPPRGV
jgi:hypothetical protein